MSEERSSAKKPVLSYLAAIAGLIVLVLVLLPIFYNPPTRSLTSSCLGNLREQGQAIMLYTDDEGGHLPPADRWSDAILHHLLRARWDTEQRVLEVFTCPALGKRERGGYAINSALSCAKPSAGKTAMRSVMIFESDPGWNVHGGPEVLLKHPRHREGINLAFVDGHVRWMKRSQTGKLLWKPSR